jgi:hypothetical protein
MIGSISFSLPRRNSLSSIYDLNKVNSVVEESRPYLDEEAPINDKSLISYEQGKQDEINFKKKIENFLGKSLPVKNDDIDPSLSEVGSENKVPSQEAPHIIAQVQQIRSQFHRGNKQDTSRSLIPEKNYYAMWSAATFLGTGTSTVFPYINWVAGQGRLGDRNYADKDANNARVINEQDRQDCHDHLNALWAILTLTELEKSATGEANIALIKSAKQEAQSLAEDTGRTFVKYVANDYWLRSWLALWRDKHLASFNTLNSVNTLATHIINFPKNPDLLGAPKNFVETVPYISAGAGLLSGLMSGAQAGFEIYNAYKSKEALSAAADLDKQVFAEYSHECPELAALIWHRQILRDSQDFLATLLACHGGVRLGNGIIAASAGLATIIIVAGGATAGAASIVAGVAGGLYLLWVNIRATIALNVQKRYDKMLRAINANNENAKGIYGLHPDKSHPSIRDIAKALSVRINNPDSATKTKTMLEALGIPKWVAESAATDGGKQLAEYLVPDRGIHVTKSDALRNVYSRSKATAQQQLRAVQEWLADPDQKELKLETIAKKTGKNTPHWSKHLAPGENMGDPCKSSLTREIIDENWNDGAFQRYMRNSLHPSDGELLSSADDAWKLLESRREKTKTQEKASATVAAWINGMKVDSIQRCLNSENEDPLTGACKDVLKKRFGIKENCKDKESIKAALRLKVSEIDLNVNTIGNFMSVYKATSAVDKVPLLKKMNEFLQKTHDEMHPDDQGEFTNMLGFKGGIFRELKLEEMDAILGKIHKFLLVSKKLHDQTLTKVIASLYKYPTGFSIPNDVARIAAIRELRNRCDTAKADMTDVGHTLALAKKLSSEKLHTTAFAAGEGGGVLSFFGYRLNQKGKFIRELVERCLSPVSSINSFSAASRLAKQLRANQIEESAHINALTYWSKKFIDTGDETDLTKIADRLDLYRTPGKLEKALKRNDLSADGPEITCLKDRLKVAGDELSKTASVLKDHTKWTKDDSSRFVTQLTEFFSLKKIAGNYKENVAVQDPVLPTELKGRLDYYSAALEWDNKTARAKNIRAIKWEFDNLKTGGLAANPFWSAKFLKTQTGLQGEVMEGMTTRYDWLSKKDSYKILVKKVNEMDSMKTSDLSSALKRSDPVSFNWIKNQFVLYGLEYPNNDVLQNLKDAAGKGDLSLLEKIAQTLQEAFGEKLQNEMAKSLQNEMAKSLQNEMAKSLQNEKEEERSLEKVVSH